MNMTYKLTRWCPKNGCTTSRLRGPTTSGGVHKEGGNISDQNGKCTMKKRDVTYMSKAKLQDIHGGNNNSIQWCIQCNRKFRSSWTFPLENMCFAPKKRHVEADTVGCQWLLGFCETSQLLLLYSYWYIRLYLQSVPPVVGCFFLSHMSLSTKKSRLIWVIINRYLSKRVPTYQ